MKLLFALLIVCIAGSTAAGPTREGSLPSAQRVLGLRRGCRPRRVYRDVACLCFVASTKNLLTRSLRRNCKAVFDRGAQFLCDRCSDFTTDGMVNAFKAIASARMIQGQCFEEVESLTLPPGSDIAGPRGGTPIQTIFDRLEDVRSLLDEALDVLDVMFVLPSVAARVVVVGEKAKAMRLVAYNDINEKRH